MTRYSFLFLLALSTTGCLSPVDDAGGTSFEAFPDETSTGVIAGSVDCAAHGARLAPGKMEEDKQRLLGIWARCDTPNTFAGPLSVSFLEVRDGSWHQLEVQADGTLARRSDFDGSGAVRFVDMGMSQKGLQADFQGTGGGWYLTQPRFEDSPGRVRFTVYGTDAVDFIRVR